jgi:trans-aconitate 2-methyltransferase
MSNVEEWYDDYADKQVKRGINDRHLSIMHKLILHGLLPNQNLLEIGAGIGTQTGLMAEYLSGGNITMNDISSRSVDIAKERLAHFNNIEYIAGDINETAVDKQFDAVVCPDVLEHIPEESHAALFKKFDDLLTQDGTVYIHIPDPFFLEWFKDHKPEVLQVIDQPLHTEMFMRNIEGTSFYIHHLETYELFYTGSDYRWIILKKKQKRNYQEIVNPGVRFHKRMLNRINIATKMLFTGKAE